MDLDFFNSGPILGRGSNLPSPFGPGGRFIVFERSFCKTVVPPVEVDYRLGPPLDAVLAIL